MIKIILGKHQHTALVAGQEYPLFHEGFVHAAESEPTAPTAPSWSDAEAVSALQTALFEDGLPRGLCPEYDAAKAAVQKAVRAGSRNASELAREMDRALVEGINSLMEEQIVIERE